MDTSQFLHGQTDRMECWDDDPDFAEIDPTFTQPLPTSSPKNNKRTSLDYRDRRESISSRMSMQSNYDFDSPESGDHERQVLLDESPAAAIASAINAGIPIPENVPSSALIGGTIKRLGTTKKARKIATHDDWGEDLELPISGMSLKVRGQGGLEFPDTLQQILSESRSPSRTNVILPPSASAQLNKYREVEEDDDFFTDTDDLPTLRLSPARRTVQPQKSNASLLLTPPLSESATRGSPSVDDDFENDFEFPADAPLQLNIKTGESNRHQVQVLDSDFEDWVDSSLGTRFEGTSRARSYNGEERLGSSIISPSVSSVTAESEDEAPLDGLELPSGILPDLAVVLERRKRASYPMDASTSFETKEDLTSKEEFFDGIEIGEGEEVFDSRKLTLNRNVKHKPATRKTSPVRRSEMSLTFTTNKSATASTPSTGMGSRGNRLLHGHPTLAPPIPILEPVAERENQPTENTSNTSTTTNTQLLRMKRSMPNIGGAAASSPAKQPRPPSRSSAGRPPSSNSQGRPPSSGGRPASRNESSRSKASGDRMDIGPGRKPSVPFLPAGSSVKQSQHISAKRSRQTLDYKESIAAERRTNSRLQQRTPRHSPSSSTASAKTKRATPTVAPEHLRREAAAIETLTQPTRKRNFGDGTELEIFDDLPTSAKLENRFVVTPVGRGAPKAIKSRSVPVHGAAGRDGESPSKKIDLTNRLSEVPRFARDTNASRNAREQKMGNPPPRGGGNPNINHWKAQVAARGTASPKSRRKPQQKPHLIKPMGNVSSLPKVTAVNGMTYNPKTYRWEGNEGDVKGFETQNPTPPRPALIANVNHNGSKLGIQVVRGMVFDPSRMCWLKVDEDPDEEEHDPFEGLDDLQDHDMISIDRYSGGMDEGFGGGNVFGGSGSGAGVGGSRGTRLSGGFGEFVVGEEFDVGPEFVRRQREEEERWRRRVEGWASQGEASKLGNKWALRELLTDQR
ncbi:hypothetical protein L873DRAFT_1766726 [Choiromyces venosus 120613-1]|uniref:Cytokinesis regulator n=1 Tax=Choiromyces venosus 120613-1 TaxID=1336337 RepID=A0A3N4JPH8_9PEZI|nr:hypothetical protein L873DRAFT_1766726 [Choiromyces venosus 120613-1]